jgi:hypothetical protein
MVNGTTYTEKLRLNTRNENRVIDTIISFGTSSAFLNNCLPFLFSLIIVLYEQLFFSQCSKPYNGTIITAWFTNIFT